MRTRKKNRLKFTFLVFFIVVITFVIFTSLQTESPLKSAYHETNIRHDEPYKSTNGLLPNWSKEKRSTTTRVPLNVLITSEKPRVTSSPTPIIFHHPVTRTRKITTSVHRNKTKYEYVEKHIKREEKVEVKLLDIDVIDPEKRSYEVPPVLIPKHIRLPDNRESSESQSEELCNPTNLGPVYVPLTVDNINAEVIGRYDKPPAGGHWKPACRATQKLLLMVPYRDREENLKIFAHHMNFFLQQQESEYLILLLHQVDRKLFNRAKLFNAGVVISSLLGNFTCFILHDVDKLPEDTSFIYKCQEKPFHMPKLLRQANSKNYENFHLYKAFFGGVSSLTPKTYFKVNGMTNEIWGWGAEDDDLSCRLQSVGMSPENSKDLSSKYVALPHPPDAVLNNRKFPKCQDVHNNMYDDGLSTVYFNLIDIVFEPLFTRLKFEL